jgi:hypothetical protein
MIEVPAEAIRAAFGEFLKETWGLDHDAAIRMARRSLKDKAAEMREAVLSSAIKEHPLHPIITYILNDVVDHGEAIDLLGKCKASLLHVRHIEEVYTVAKFLLTEKARHEEFGWRWSNFGTLHAIRNRILNLKQPLDDLMVEFLKANINDMKAHFSKKFEVDETQCIPQWEKLSNWMMDITLKDVFEKAGRKQSYISASYDWNSQAVHLSPLGDQYLGYKLKHMDSGDFALDTANTWVQKLCHECAPMVADQDRLRDYYFRQVMVETYGMLVARPSQYVDMAVKGGQYGALTEEILQKPFRMDRVRNVAIGAPPVDPYVLSFAVPAADAAASATAVSSSSDGAV